jgi:hypothetical protein
MLTFSSAKLDPAGPLYKLFVPATAAGANKVYFDLFNNSDKAIEIASVTPIISGAVAVVGTLAVDLFLTRTTAIGTGGTGATQEGTALNAATFTRLDPDAPPLRAGITARFTPAGGATAGAVLAFNSHFTEETNIASYFRMNLAQVGPAANDGKITVRPGTGIRVVQGAVASVGNIGFDVLFQVIDN